MNKINRFKVILSTLNRPYDHLGVTAHSLAEKLEVVDKTVYRDLQELNCIIDEYLIDHKLFPYDYDDETDPIYFDWGKKTYRIRKELLGVGLGQLWGLN